MAYRDWKVIKIAYCEHAGEEVYLEADIVYPATFLPKSSTAHPGASLLARFSMQ